MCGSCEGTPCISTQQPCLLERARRFTRQQDCSFEGASVSVHLKQCVATAGYSSSERLFSCKRRATEASCALRPCATDRKQRKTFVTALVCVFERYFRECSGCDIQTMHLPLYTTTPRMTQFLLQTCTIHNSYTHIRPHILLFVDAHCSTTSC